MPTDPIRVLLVDDDAARVTALRALLESADSAAFDVGHAGRLDGAVAALESASYDVVLAELRLEDSRGLPTLAILLTHAGAAPVIVLSDHADDPVPLRALQAGAHDLLPRDQLYPTPVVRTIRYAVEQSRAAVALRESEQRYRALFQQSRDAIYVADAEGRIEEVNRAALELLGYPAEALIGRRVASLFVDPLEYDQLEQELTRSGFLRDVEVRLETRDGLPVWCLLAVAERRASSGTLLGWQGIIHDISERKRAELRLQHDALHDPLTGLPNRMLFLDRLAQAVRRAERNQEPSFALLFLDLDRFKGVNDTLGHAAGDRVLRRTAEVLRSCVRAPDTVGRLGGDEFVVLLDGIESVPYALQVADRILTLLDRPYRLKGREFFTTASIGVTWPTDGTGTPDALLREADMAMYRAKVRGGARCEVYDPEMQRAAVSKLELESDLRHALEHDELILVYQPILSFDTGRIAGFEALARWLHPRRGLLQPGAFIPLAEETGLIVPLGFWTLRHATRQIRTWRTTVPAARDATVSINLSPRQFVEADLVERIHAIVQEEGGRPEWVRLELTENALMQDPEQAAHKLARLQELGFSLCLDDFGTGYSSLAYLRKFPLDRLKVDRSFVGRLEDSPRDLELVATITGLARSLGIHSIVEGVETEGQLDRLRHLRPQEVQGYLFSRPVDPVAAAGFFGTTSPGLGGDGPTFTSRIARWLGGGDV